MDFSWSLILVEANFGASALLKFWLTSLKSCIRPCELKHLVFNPCPIQALFNFPTYQNLFKKQFVFFPFFKSVQWTIRFSEQHPLKFSRSHNIVVLSKSKKSTTKTKLKMVFISCANIWSNVVAILLRILQKQSNNRNTLTTETI